MKEIVERLIASGIKPSAQRVAVAEFVLSTRDHPSADSVWNGVQRTFPMISRATVYNTLNLFVSKGLLRQHVLTEGSVVFDPNMAPHHHFVDDATGAIHDVPWETIEVRNIDKLKGYDVNDYQVVMRGRSTKKKY